MGLMDRLTGNLRLMLQRPARQQYAALCYRLTKKRTQLEVLVATSRDTGRWVIPKGWPMKDKKAHQVAEREAYEEVGVKGKVEKDALGFFHYRKTLDSGLKVLVRVQVHALEVAGTENSLPAVCRKNGSASFNGADQGRRLTVRSTNQNRILE